MGWIMARIINPQIILTPPQWQALPQGVAKLKLYNASEIKVVQRARLAWHNYGKYHVDPRKVVKVVKLDPCKVGPKCASTVN